MRAEDLDKFSYEVDDLFSMGFDMSPFRARLDLLSSIFRVALCTEVALCQHEDDLFLVQLSDLQNVSAKLKSQLRELESTTRDVERLRASTTRDVERLRTSNVKIRDSAIADLEALAMPPLQFDMS